MKSFGLIISLLLVLNLAGCYTVVYHSDNYEPQYSEPIYVLVPVPVPVPQPLPVPPQPIPSNPPEVKERGSNNSGNNSSSSYTSRDEIRNSGGRGTEERRIQGR